MRICKVQDCRNKFLAKGYCIKHYQKYRKYGDPLITKYERHGMRKTAEYIIWVNMRIRCYRKTYYLFNRYGGRGITVCKRWRDSFKAFYTDMGPKPFPKAQIDRIDNDGNYELGNCRWVTCAENIRNSSRAKITMQKAKEIRAKYKAGGITKKRLGLIYGISGANIGDVINNRIWREAT